MAKKYVRRMTVVMCTVGLMDVQVEVKLEVGLNQGLALGPFLFSMVMDRLKDEARLESPWTIVFVDDIVIFSRSREQVEEKMER